MENSVKRRETARESAFTSFKKFIVKFKKKKRFLYKANEATTRLLIIDEILQILGWQKKDFNPETYCKGAGFLDYLLKNGAVSRLVVEAKKGGNTFNSPSQQLTKQEYKTSYFKRAFKNNLTEVIEQAQKYCMEQCVSYAVITNGGEWLVLQLIPRPGKSVESMRGVYFGNIFSEQFSFDFFWSLLSKEAIQKGTLEDHLTALNYSASQVCKIINSDYGSLQWRNPKETKLLEEFYEYFFTQITESNQRKMLEHCFVSDSKLDQYKGDLKRVLKDTLPRFLPSDTDDLEPGEGKDVLLNDRNSGRVIIITGSIGCGKTTLVTKSIVEARQAKKNAAIPILVDLINDVKVTNKSAQEIVFNYIYASLLKYFDDELTLPNLRRTFQKEIRDLKRGEYSELFKIEDGLYARKEAELLNKLKSDQESFILKTLRRKSNDGDSVILILDNIDRASEEFQEEAYALAHKIASETGASVIVTLREFTFFKNKDKGFLDVRPEDKVIHLKAPDFGKLIAKRIKYVQNNFDDDFRIKDWRKHYKLNEFKSSMISHALSIKESIQENREGSTILGTLSSVSWHNIRLFFDLLKRVHSQLGNTKSLWSNTDVIAALMCSPVVDEPTYLPNIYKPYQNENQCYFLKLRVLLFLNYSLKSGEKIHGVPENRVINFARLYGYNANWVRHIIEECVRERLVECLEIPSDGDLTQNYELNVSGTFRISPLGVAYILTIVREPIYLSLLAVDLPFHELDIFRSVKNEFDNVSTLMNDEASSVIFRDGIELIVQSKLRHLVSTYLVEQYERECVPSGSLEAQTEINLTENKLKEILVGISGEAGSSIAQPLSTKVTAIQATLFEDEDDEIDLSLLESLIPNNINTLKYDNSEYVPLIYCALVIQKILGKESSFGIDITNIINEYLVNEENKKFTNNVSRALRSKLLIEQEWLMVRKNMHKKYKKFSLSSSWKQYFQEIMGIKLPNECEFLE